MGLVKTYIVFPADLIGGGFVSLLPSGNVELFFVVMIGFEDA